MTAWALTLILAAAFIHASWNLLNKRASGHATFTWLVAVLSVVFYAPLAAAVIFYWRMPIDHYAVVFIAGSTLLHTGYFILLNEGYRSGDLSLVYPLARGSGPLLSCAGAMGFFGERPSGLALAGAILIVLGLIALTSGSWNSRHDPARKAVMYALITGAFIAAYTLWDKQAVSRFGVAPIVLDWGTNLARAVLLTPFALRHWRYTRTEWRTHRTEAVGVALLVPLSYILVLTAMQFTPVSYVAPAREISILFGTAMGTQLLSEGEGGRRLIAAGLMVLGVVALAVG